MVRRHAGDVRAAWYAANMLEQQEAAFLRDVALSLTNLPRSTAVALREAGYELKTCATCEGHTTEVFAERNPFGHCYW